MTAAIYVRISQDRADTRSGIGRQLEDCRQLATKLELEVAFELSDNDTSAYRRSKQRRAWTELVELAQAGLIDTILTWHPDRLYRHPADLEELITFVEQHHLTIHTVTAGSMDLNTPSGRMIARMLGAAARQEVEHKAERQARKHRELAEQGKWHGGRRPLGYEADGVTIRETEAQILRTCASRLTAEDRPWSLAAASRWATAEWPWGNHFRTSIEVADDGSERSAVHDHHRNGTPHPRIIKARVLRDALTNPRIAGFRQYWPQSARDTHARERRKGLAQGDFPREPSMTPAVWPGILDEPTWRSVRAVLLAPDRRSQPGRPTKSLLGGLLLCELCGRSLGYSANTYKCSASSGGCAKVSVSTRAVEQHVTRAVLATLEASTESILARASAQPRPSDGLESRRLTALYDSLPDLYREGTISLDELRAQRAKVKESLAAVRDTDFAAAGARDLNYAALMSAASDWSSAPSAVQSAAIRTLIQSVTVRPSPQGAKSGAKFDPNRLVLNWRA